MIRLTLAIAMLGLAGLPLNRRSSRSGWIHGQQQSHRRRRRFRLLDRRRRRPIYCGETETNQLSWQIKKEGKASESGAELALNFKSWGTCLVKYKEGKLTKEATLSGGECAWESSEPGSEREVTAKIASTCKLKGEIAKKPCEVTLGTKSNEKLSNLTLINSGENNEHLAVEIALKGATVGASGAGCEIAGIKSTSTAKLTGAIEALEITPGVAAPLFTVSFGPTGNAMRVVNETRTAIVTNHGTSRRPGQRGGRRLVHGRRLGQVQRTRRPSGDLSDHFPGDEPIVHHDGQIRGSFKRRREARSESRRK